MRPTPSSSTPVRSATMPSRKSCTALKHSLLCVNQGEAAPSLRGRAGEGPPLSSASSDVWQNVSKTICSTSTVPTSWLVPTPIWHCPTLSPRPRQDTRPSTSSFRPPRPTATSCRSAWPWVTASAGLSASCAAATISATTVSCPTPADVSARAMWKASCEKFVTCATAASRR